ncbi:cell wall-binding repeat-containing protein [Catenulispora sp. GP43]|uniref:cell wall-binding repeat-containing protein n=1 Tax=Catenulispora sp. GP43 TaxID=3156263 RepID=UPI00351539F9
MTGSTLVAWLAPVTAHAAGNTVLVEPGRSTCSDKPSSPGNAAVPFCTVAGAFASPLVTAGTTLNLIGQFQGGIDVTKSGVTLSGIAASITGGPYGVLIDHQHDVTLSNVKIAGTAGEAVIARASQNVTLTRPGLGDSQSGVAAPDPTIPALRLDGVTGATVTGGEIAGAKGPGISVTGSSDVVIADDLVAADDGGGITVADSGTVDVVSNTLDGNGGSSIAVTGTSSDVGVENDIASQATTLGSRVGIALDLSASGTVKVGYNILTTAAPGGPVVRWNGSPYADAAAFDTAGGGSHDLTADPGFWSPVPAPGAGRQRPEYDLVTGSPAIDSADSGARDEPSADISGDARVDDPEVADTGVGPVSYADRGAFEFSRPVTPWIQVSGSGGITPQDYRTETMNVSVGPSWSPVVSYDVFFGDGESTGPQTSPDAVHTYKADGTYTVKVEVTDAGGSTFSTTTQTWVQPETFTPDIYVAPGGPGTDIPQGSVFAESMDTGRTLVSATATFGDGSAPVTQKTAFGTFVHPYAASGTYNVTITVTDQYGWTGSASQNVTITVPPAPPTPPQPKPPVKPTVRRIGGTDRYDTGRLASQAQWRDGAAASVVLARGDASPDALAGVPLAAHFHGPLLLTDPSRLDTATRAEIDRVLGGPGTHKIVYVLGGASAVSPDIEKSLRSAGYTVVRYGGGDRFQTALQIAASFGPTPEAIVATGKDFPDALAAGPLGAVRDAPIVLSDGPTLDPATAAFLAGHKTVDAVGGAAVTAVGTLKTAAKTVNRLAGPDRFATAEDVAAAVVHTTGSAPTGVGVAYAYNFPDALTGGAFAANARQPLLLTGTESADPGLLVTLHGWSSTLHGVEVFGGANAIGQEVVNQIATVLGGQLG